MDSWVLRIMKSFRGPWARSKNSSWVISPAVYGSRASSRTLLTVGVMVNRVRMRAIPTSTMFGGVCWVPMAVRRKAAA